eukprot:scaffold207456_cov19-Prasinocladus_malaysianus.AAC.1
MPANEQIHGSSGPTTSGVHPVEDTDEEVALVRFRVRECCLYSVPPASSIGHRAELWDVDKWIQACTAFNSLEMTARLRAMKKVACEHDISLCQQKVDTEHSIISVYQRSVPIDIYH